MKSYLLPAVALLSVLGAGEASAGSFLHRLERGWHKFEHHEEHLVWKDARRYARNWERDWFREKFHQQLPQWVERYR